MEVRPQKRSLTLNGHKTSVTLEDRFWRAVRIIAKNKNISVSALVAEIDSHRDLNSSLASTIRDFVLRYYVGKDRPERK